MATNPVTIGDMRTLIGQVLTVYATIGKARVPTTVKVLDIRQAWGRIDALITGNVSNWQPGDGSSCWVSVDSLVIVPSPK